MMKKRMLAALLVAAMAVSAVTGCGKSASYPSKPVTVVCPFAAGGGNDTIIRALVDCAKDKFPKGIAVENRTGSGGAVGMSYGQNAKADGYTITNIAVELVTLPHAGSGGDVYYDKWTPIMMPNYSCSVITVRSDSPYQTLDELLEASKTTKLQAGNSGVGAIWHLANVALEQAAGTSFTHVPFEGGAPMITSLLGGHLDFISCSYAEVYPHVASGDLRVLAALTDERMEEAPDIPTAKELGYDVSVGAWRGLGVPKDTPQEIVDYLEEAFIEAANSDKFKEFMAGAMYPVVIEDSETLGKRIERENEMFKELIGSMEIGQ